MLDNPWIKKPIFFNKKEMNQTSSVSVCANFNMSKYHYYYTSTSWASGELVQQRYLPFNFIIKKRTMHNSSSSSSSSSYPDFSDFTLKQVIQLLCLSTLPEGR